MFKKGIQTGTLLLIVLTFGLSFTGCFFTKGGYSTYSSRTYDTYESSEPSSTYQSTPQHHEYKSYDKHRYNRHHHRRHHDRHRSNDRPKFYGPRTYQY